MMDKKKISKIVLVALTVLWMAFIFVMSSKDAATSENYSHSVGMTIGSIVIAEFDSWDEADRIAFAEAIDFPVRKCAHAAEFAVLAILLFDSIAAVKELDIFRTESIEHILYPWVIAALYGVTDEIHQLFVPGRAFMFLDILIDGIGAAGGLAAMCLCIWAVNKWFSNYI